MATKTSPKIPESSSPKPVKKNKAAAIKAAKATKPAPKEAPATTRKKRVAKAASSKIGTSLSLNPKPVVKEPVLAHDDIALRAYFIAERRHKMGWPGDSSTDWSDAVKQLRTEALEKPLKKR